MPATLPLEILRLANADADVALPASVGPRSLCNKELDVLVTSLGRDKALWRRSLLLLDWLLAHGHQPDARLTETLIRICSQNGQHRQALDLYEWMKLSKDAGGAGLLPSVFTYTTTMRAALAGNLLDAAVAVWTDAEAANVPPDSHLCCAYMEACMRRGQLADVLEVFDGMKRSAPRPTAHAYTIVMRALTAAGQPQAALEVWEDLQARRELRLSGHAYTAAISACTAMRDARRAQHIFDGMRADQIKPDVVSCTALVSALGATRQWYRCKLLLDQMQEWGLQPNVRTYTALLAALADAKQWRKMLRLLRSMQAEGWDGPPPNAHVYSLVIKALGDAGQVVLAEKVFAELESATGGSGAAAAAAAAALPRCAPLQSVLSRATQRAEAPRNDRLPAEPAVCAEAADQREGGAAGASTSASEESARPSASEDSARPRDLPQRVQERPQGANERDADSTSSMARHLASSSAPSSSAAEGCADIGTGRPVGQSSSAAEGSESNGSGRSRAAAGIQSLDETVQAPAVPASTAAAAGVTFPVQALAPPIPPDAARPRPEPQPAVALQPRPTSVSSVERVVQAMRAMGLRRGRTNCLQRAEAQAQVEKLMLLDVPVQAAARHLVINEVVCGALIHAYEGAHMWREAVAVLGRARALGIAPNTIMHNTAISAAGCAGQPVVAHVLFDAVPQRDGVTYESLIVAYGWAGAAAAAEATFEQMLADGFEPRDYAYVGLIAAHSGSGNLRAALGVRRRMEQHGHAATVHVLNALMIECENHGRYEQAIRVFVAMKRAGVVPDAFTHEILAQVCKMQYSSIEAQQAAFAALSAAAAAVGTVLMRTGVF